MKRYVLEYIHKESGELVVAEFDEHNLARTVGREIALSVGKRVVIKQVPIAPREEYELWYFLKHSNRFIRLNDKSYTRRQCAKIFMRTIHENGVPVAMPKGMRPPRVG
jgi:hypothetical protein